VKAIRWPFWAVLAVMVAAWVVLGFTLPGQAVNLNDVYDVAALAAFGAALLFIVVYTIAGLTGPAKWWRNNIGTYLVLAAGSVLFIVGPVAFAVLFHHGLLDTWWWAWAYTGGHFLTAVMWALLGWLWLRNRTPDGGS
jgi:hypothetical protein